MPAIFANRSLVYLFDFNWLLAALVRPGVNRMSRF
jgi:hypothetical protein